MPDFHARFTEVDLVSATEGAGVVEVRPVDPRHGVGAQVDELALPPGTRVLEVGCGTGTLTRLLAGDPRVKEVVGVDSSADHVARARQLAAGLPGVRFDVAHGTGLPFGAGSFDSVVLHRVLSHASRPEQVLAEGWRVLRHEGSLSIFDGNYATFTLATDEADPLQSCVSAFVPSCIRDPWIVQRLSGMVAAAGFVGGRLRSFGEVQLDDPEYMMSIVERGAAALVAANRIGPQLGEALRTEARRRAAAGTLLGHIAYACLIARKP